MIKCGSRPRPGSARSAGYALVLVLVGVAVLALIAGTVTVMSTRSAGRLPKDLLRAQLQCAVQAGISEAIVSLSDLRPAEQWPIDGSAHDLSFQGIPVTVSIESELGKVDLNGAGQSLLTGLFMAAGEDQSTADMFADRILDWREPDDLKRLNGAKAADYLAAALPYRPRGGPFQTIDELRLVLGMTPALYEQLAPAITVYSHLSFPQWQTAPPIVLQATGMDAASIEVIMAARARANTVPAAGGSGSGQALSILGLPNTEFTISAQARSNGIFAARTETIRFTGNPQKPYFILARRQ